MQKYDFSYDKENDDLFLYSPKAKSKGSIELGDLIFDYDSKKNLVGIQIINASRLVKDISDEKISSVKKILLNLSSCKVDVKNRNNILVIKIYLIGDDKEVTSTISIPNITESSPALACA